MKALNHLDTTAVSGGNYIGEIASAGLAGGSVALVTGILIAPIGSPLLPIMGAGAALFTGYKVIMDVSDGVDAAANYFNQPDVI